MAILHSHARAVLVETVYDCYNMEITLIKLERGGQVSVTYSIEGESITLSELEEISLVNSVIIEICDAVRKRVSGS